MTTRRLVPAVPFALSLCLSLFTVGSHPFWQDSGLYLIAIKELGVLYPPGFVLYEILCFLWTKLFFFLDFTLAVHLFSSFCSALAAAAMALATRDLLRSRGKLFRVTSEDPGTLADVCGMLAGVLLSVGFTFWSTAIYAKVYAFYYLILSLLLWRMIRADDGGRPRDFTIAVVLIGLAWQAHPSAVLIGGALVLFVAAHFGSLGWKGVVGRTLIAAACAVGPTILFLPMLIARDPWLTFGHPTDLWSFLRHVTGIRFVGMHGVFGLDASRVLSFVRFLWEDLLGVGLLLTVLGLVVVARRNVRLLAGLLAWLLPFAVVTILFKSEGQHDCWFVAARLPLHLALGVGALHLALRARAHAPVWIAVAGVIGVGWAVFVNVPDLTQRNYLLAEHYGRTLIESVDRNAIVILSGDDSNGLAGYLHRVRRERDDIILVTSSFLYSEATSGFDWYEASFFRRHPSLARPDYAALRVSFPNLELKQVATAAFINANAGGERPIFCEFLLPPELVRPETMMVPAGVHWKVVPRAAKTAPDPRYWKFPIEPEEIRPLYRRARGQNVVYSGEGGVRVKPERYERRLAALILNARFRLALAQADNGEYARAARLCQSIIDFDDEEFESNPEIIHLLGISYYAAGQQDKAEPALRRSAEISVRKESRATALFYLGEIAEKRGDPEGARRYYDQAFSIPGLDPAYVREMQARRK